MGFAVQNKLKHPASVWGISKSKNIEVAKSINCFGCPHIYSAQAAEAVDI